MAITREDRINYLRLSITDRCNLRCIYCLPFGKDRFVPDGGILGFEEIVEAVDILSRKGIEFVRLTGGEPLARDGVEGLIKMLRKNSRLKEISMTTNGILLRERLPLLIRNGLGRLNISLNTFKKERYRRLTGADKFEEVLASIKGTLSIPAFLLKINTVILKGINDDEIVDFAAFTLKNRVSLRFIEYLPLNNGESTLQFVPNPLVKRIIEARFGPLIPDETMGRGPAINYRIDNAQGQIGFINTRASDICQNCNRLRLTAAGRLYPCLFSRSSIDLRRMIRNNIDRKKIGGCIDDLIFKKRIYSKRREEHEVVMSDMGG
ncbi:GTP 3',8-cyclase MoaA [Omnitrophica bacterium]|nr:GTP 3',8-cyclase MoaA [Candidatus Omnitrophota bacterium]